MVIWIEEQLEAVWWNLSKTMLKYCRDKSLVGDRLADNHQKPRVVPGSSRNYHHPSGH